MKIEKNYTPGPWKHEKDIECLCDGYAITCIHKDTPGNKDDVAYVTIYENIEISKPDADLITASPDMAEALIAVYEYYSGKHDPFSAAQNAYSKMHGKVMSALMKAGVLVDE